MGSAVRNTLGQGRASPCPAHRVLRAQAAGLAAARRAPGSEEAGQRWLQLLGTSRVLGADGRKKSRFNLQTEQIGEETHRRQLHLEC